LFFVLCRLNRRTDITLNSGHTLFVFLDKSCGRCLPSINEREVFGLKDFYDPDSPCETFRVRLVLQAWDKKEGK
ncbi:MAG: hypothetical protein KKH04_01505, partial [Proteobacteria bacterium]|nr:hypothetical protein [Pseudomonadota bacterium]